MADIVLRDGTSLPLGRGRRGIMKDDLAEHSVRGSTGGRVTSRGCRPRALPPRCRARGASPAQAQK